MPIKVGSEKQQFKFNKTYDIELIIKDLDYSMDILKVDIYNSLATAYPVYEILLMIDSDDIAIEKLYGDDSMRLIITLKAYEGEMGMAGPKYEFGLMLLKGDFDLTVKPNVTEDFKQKERTFYKMTCVDKRAFKTMTSLVNEVYIGSTVEEIVYNLCSKVGARVAFDDNANTTSIDQVCIPPTTLYNIIKEYNPNSSNLYDGYLDGRFGLFKEGVPGVYCNSRGTVVIKNLSRKMKMNQEFTIYHLSGNLDNIADIINLCENTEGKNFYTYDSLLTEYAGSARFATVASSINHVVKPNNRLSDIITQDLNNIGKNNSLAYFPNKQVDLPHDGNIERKRYYTEDTGYNTETSSFLSRYGRAMADLSTVSLNLEKNLNIFGLMEVGEAVKINTFAIEKKDLEGKYILWSSKLEFSRGIEWKSVARINLMRTNKYI